jgi:hypothetical protein
MHNPYEVPVSMAPINRRSVVPTIGILLTFVTVTVSLPILLLVLGIILNVDWFHEHEQLKTAALILMRMSDQLLLPSSAICFANSIYLFLSNRGGTPILNAIMSTLVCLAMIAFSSAT